MLTSPCRDMPMSRGIARRSKDHENRWSELTPTVHRHIPSSAYRHGPKTPFPHDEVHPQARRSSRTLKTSNFAQDRAISTFSTRRFSTCVRRVNDREACIYQALERTSTREDGENGRAKSVRCENRIL